MLEAITKLIKVKSILTLVLTAVFAYLSVVGTITADQFMTIFTTIVGFYFGTQYEKTTSNSSNGQNASSEATQDATRN